jgi:4-hydroxymandelate oxidase
MGGVGIKILLSITYDLYKNIKIIPRYIHPQIQPDIRIELFGKVLNTPIMIAPMTGASTT